ncbi:MAG: hypothetical protein FWE02_01745 [Defluviitaleaceae bacterium]|nr:hypothetical protein [Defluviitaleaceae bacterium]
MVDWLIEESFGIYEPHEITHYCIVTADEVIDIASSFIPDIKVYGINV